MRPVLPALLLAGLVLAGAAGGAETRSPSIGAEVPDLTLSDHQGRSFRLSDVLRQRDFVVLAFYVKAFTGG